MWLPTETEFLYDEEGNPTEAILWFYYKTDPLSQNTNRIWLNALVWHDDVFMGAREPVSQIAAPSGSRTFITVTLAGPGTYSFIAALGQKGSDPESASARGAFDAPAKKPDKNKNIRTSPKPKSFAVCFAGRACGFG